jgi:hypothetical protein
LLRIGEAPNDALLISLGHHLLGYNYIGLGEFTLARAELEQTLLAMSDPALRTAATALTESGEELVALLSHLAVPLAQLGYLDQARARRDAAIVEARKLRHAFTLAFALGFSLHIEEAASEAVMLRAEERWLSRRNTAFLFGRRGEPYIGAGALPWWAARQRASRK